MVLATPSIGGVDVPADLRRGMYMFYPQEVEIAGDGTAIPVGTQSAIWRYERMTAAQLNWWRWTALLGGASRSTTFALWTNNDRTNTTSFTSGIVYGPDWRTIEAHPAALYGPVEFRFDFLLPISYGVPAFILGTSLLGGSEVLAGAI